MRVADYVVDFLEAQGVSNIFMLTGTGSIYLDDAVARAKTLDYKCARHEAAAVAMAVATAKLTRRPGVALVTTGPGGLNAVPGVAEAFVDSVPLLVISGQEPSAHVKRGPRSFGIQGFDITRVIEPITKYAAVVREAATIVDHMSAAWSAALTGRQGPSWIDIPFDVQNAELGATKIPPTYRAAASAPQDPTNGRRQAEIAFRELRNAQRPMIVLGGGVTGDRTAAAYLEIAERLHAPILLSRGAIGLVPYTHPNCFGLLGIRGRAHNARICKEADTILAVGTTMGAGLCGYGFDSLHDDSKLTLVNIEEDAFSEFRRGRTELVRSTSESFAAICLELLDLDPALRSKGHEWLDRCQSLKQGEFTLAWMRTDTNALTIEHFVRALDEASGVEDILVSDAGGAYYATGRQLRFERKQKEVTATTYATMGLALPYAIGAAAEFPNRRILAVTGDGSIELNIQELRTLSQHNLSVKLFVINNGGYASIRDSQDEYCAGPYIDAMAPLCFHKIAHAFELNYKRIDGATNLTSTLATLLSSPGPSLIEVMCGNQDGAS
jgi:acetolactate synthase-1/2/3 large subunit